MKKILVFWCICLLLPGALWAGMLEGRIIRADGSSLSNKAIVIQGNEIRTNQFGGYEVNLPDGDQQLSVSIDGQTYAAEGVRIYSPRTRQNWRLDQGKKLLRKIP